MTFVSFRVSFCVCFALCIGLRGVVSMYRALRVYYAFFVVVDEYVHIWSYSRADLALPTHVAAGPSCVAKKNEHDGSQVCYKVLH